MATSFEFEGKSLETETKEVLDEGKANIEQVIGSKERTKHKWVGLWESQSWILARKSTISVELFEL